MALRVLLADESSTIKKVMQLALQDFGVEVKSVPIGLDVLQVARSFQPDLILADVLLAKKSGYEVAAEIKADAHLRRTPVILMWSGFMELDEARASQCGAEKRLEKPFDADHLRALVKELVPRLQENQISDYLSFPDLPEIIETPVVPTAAPSAPPPLAPKAVPRASEAPPARQAIPDPAPSFTKEDIDLEDPDDFQQIPLPGSKTKNVFEKRDEEEWRQGGLEQFRVAPASAKDDPFMDVSDAALATTDGSSDLNLEDLEDLTQNSKFKTPPPPPAPRQRVTAAPPLVDPAPKAASMAATATPARSSAPLVASVGTVDPLRAEEILREQAREVLESIAWKIIPDIVERVVREEIQRLLKEAERFP